MSKEVVKKEKQEVAVANDTRAVVAKIAASQDEYREANKNFGLDYVYTGSWMVINSKGQFSEKDTDKVFSDELDCVMLSGEERFVLWGERGTSSEGKVLVSEHTMDAAMDKYEELPEIVKEEHSSSKIQSRYLTTVIPTECLKEDVPSMYLLSFSKTAKISFGKWSHALYMGRYADIGCPAKTKVNEVIVRMRTVEKKGDGFKYTTIEFDTVGPLT